MIDDIFEFCDRHPSKGLNARWFVPYFSSGLPAIIDMRSHGIVGFMLDRAITANGDIPYEIIGGSLTKQNARSFFDAVLDRAKQLAIRRLEFPIREGLEEICQEIINRRQAEYSFSEWDMTCPKLKSLGQFILPANWHWEDMSEHWLMEYDRLRRVAFVGILGVILRQEPPTYQDILRRNNKIRLLVEGERIIGAIQLDIQKRFIWTIMRDPQSRGKGIGTALMEETIHQMGEGQEVALNVIEGNLPAIALYKKYGFVMEKSTPYYSLPIH